MYPSDLLYTKDHEWVRPSGTFWRVGITEFAAKQLGDVVMVDGPQANTRCERGQGVGTIESVKAVSEIFSPVAGTVKASNAELMDSPELINEDPYGDGWIYEIEPSGASEKDELMSATDYAAFVKEEAES
jgi:glycine cleavage system H protein